VTTGRHRYIAAPAMVAFASVSATASAQTQVAIGADVGLPFQGTTFSHLASAFETSVRVGIRQGLPRAWLLHSVILEPEAIFTQYQPVSRNLDPDLGFGVGGRIGLLLNWLQPFGFVHGREVMTTNSGGWNPALDAGGALDLRLWTGTAIGCHFSYNVQEFLPNYYELGLHLSTVFVVGE
jgi:hypothetical protein